MEFPGNSEHQPGKAGAGVATILVLALVAGYVLFLYPGAVSKFGTEIALLRHHH